MIQCIGIQPKEIVYAQEKPKLIFQLSGFSFHPKVNKVMLLLKENV